MSIPMNARKIQAWRDANPGTRITEAILLDLLGLKTLRYADLQGANLQGADLRGANLQGADLRGGLPLQAGESGSGYFLPTPDGWRITIGCWQDKTLADLGDLIHDRTEWPEAEGAERERRRPMLIAVKALCEAHMGQHEGLIEELAQKWKEVGE